MDLDDEILHGIKLMENKIENLYENNYDFNNDTPMNERIAMLIDAIADVRYAYVIIARKNDDSDQNEVIEKLHDVYKETDAILNHLVEMNGMNDGISNAFEAMAVSPVGISTSADIKVSHNKKIIVFSGEKSDIEYINDIMKKEHKTTSIHDVHDGVHQVTYYLHDLYHLIKAGLIAITKDGDYIYNKKRPRDVIDLSIDEQPKKVKKLVPPPLKFPVYEPPPVLVPILVPPPLKIPVYEPPPALVPIAVPVPVFVPAFIPELEPELEKITYKPIKGDENKIITPHVPAKYRDDDNFLRKSTVPIRSNYHIFRGIVDNKRLLQKHIELNIQNSSFFNPSSYGINGLMYFQSKASALSKEYFDDAGMKNSRKHVIVYGKYNEFVMKAMEKKRRFIMCFISLIITRTSAHSNLIVLDTKYMNMYRFEPHGSVTNCYKVKKLDDELTEVCKGDSILGNFTYKKSIDWQVEVGVQRLEKLQTQFGYIQRLVFGKMRLVESGGYCVAWVSLFAILVSSHQDENLEEIYARFSTDPNELASLVRGYMSRVVSGAIGKKIRDF